MGKHRKTDQEKNKRALEFYNAGNPELARRIISSTSKENQQEIADRIIKGLRIINDGRKT